MTLREYGLRQQAHHLQENDEIEKLATAAFFNRRVNQTEDRGGTSYYKYNSVRALYDHPAQEAQIWGDVTPPEFDELLQRAKRLQLHRAKKGKQQWPDNMAATTHSY